MISEKPFRHFFLVLILVTGLLQARIAKGMEHESSPAVPSPHPAAGKHETLEEKAHAHVKNGVFSQYAQEWYGIAFYGYGNASYIYNFNSPSTGINNLRGFDVGSDAIRLHLAQFVLDRGAKVQGSWLDRIGARVKFNIGSDSRSVLGTNVGNDADFQEWFLQYIAPIGNGVNIQFGRINSLIGFEVIESPYNFNYSRSLLFNLGQPFTTVGARLTYQFNDSVTLSAAAINSIDSLTTTSTRHPKVESAVTFTPHDSIRVALYGLYGFVDGAAGNSGRNSDTGRGIHPYGTCPSSRTRSRGLLRESIQ